MRKILLGLVALAAIATPVTLLAAPANASSTDHRTCVTAGEWKQIHAHQSKAEVTRILDGPGRLWWSDVHGNQVDQWRTFKPCPAFGNDQALVVWMDNYVAGGPGFRVWDKYRSTNPSWHY